MLGKDKTPKEDQILEEGDIDVRVPYSSPELRVYGDIAKLTQFSGNMGLPDSGTVMGAMMSQ
ncbi:MAG TPA: hypothetical protein VNY05_11355 [Candidatus Acidoferrales bacterium]|jgi:hypothetical protein|nr:hypothetical protein [Candidatus Acidoferrales bacterium]